MTLSPEALDELERLLSTATDGPWQWLDSGGDPGDYDELQDGNGEMVASGFRDDVLRSTVTDGRLCAALRNAAPDLIAAVRVEAAARAMFAQEDGVCVECGWVGDHDDPSADSFARECLTLPLRAALRAKP